MLCSNLLNLGNLQYYRVGWLGTRGRGMAGVKNHCGYVPVSNTPWSGSRLNIAAFFFCKAGGLI